MALGVAILVGVIVVVLAWVFLSGATIRRSSKEAARQDSPGAPGVETLRYQVPDPQDPTVLITALDQAGYTADLDDQAGTKVLEIACPAGRDRDRSRVREVIAEADTMSLEGPRFRPGKVTFEDE